MTGFILSFHLHYKQAIHYVHRDYDAFAERKRCSNKASAFYFARTSGALSVALKHFGFQTAATHSQNISLLFSFSSVVSNGVFLTLSLPTYDEIDLRHLTAP